MYYVAGNLSSPIAVALRKDDVNLPIDFLHVGSTNISEFYYRETSLGRHRQDIQVWEKTEGILL